MANNKKPVLGKANQARRNVESSALNKASGKFKTGANANPATKRLNTRSAVKNNAIKDQNK